MSKKFISLLTILAIISSVLVGCNQPAVNKETNQPAVKEEVNEEVSEEVEDSNEVELEDMAGRKVTVPTEVNKVFSTSPVGTVLVYSLNPDKMAGWNYDLREGEKKFIPEKYHDLPNLGGAGKESINTEEILKVDPDVLISIGKIDDTLVSQVEEMEKKMGKTIVILDGDINKLDEAYEILGKIMGEEDKAKELAEYCKETLDDIAEKAPKITEDEKVDVYYAEGPEGLQTEPSGSSHAEVIDMVGGNNVAEVEIKGGKGKSEVSIEQVMSWDPDIIISWDDERGGCYSGILEDPAWKDIKAVKDEEVYEIPNKPFNWFDRPPSANRILGLRWIGNLLYPDIYDYDMKEEVKEFYEKFYHSELSEEEITELLENTIRH